MTSATHNMPLFERLLSLSEALSSEARAGRMFGCPAVFVGRRLAACVYQQEVALRVPAELAEAARSTRRARSFTPYGKHPMREWIALDVSVQDIPMATDLLEAAIRFAERNSAK